jgi:hypothetical protein
MRCKSTVSLAALLALTRLATGAGAPKKDGGPDNPFRKAEFLAQWERTAPLVDVERGMLVFQGTRTVERLAVFRDDLSFTDTVMSAVFLVDRDGRAGHCFGLAFNSTDSLNYYAVEVARTELRVIRVAEGKTERVLARRRISDDEGQWRRLRLTQHEGQVYVYYQADLPEGQVQRMFDLEMAEPPAGRIGLYAEGVHVRVRDLTFRGKEFPMEREWTLRTGEKQEE